MATTLQPAGTPAGSPAAPRCMTRCECAGLAFGEIARRIREEGASFEDVARRTGCGSTCTACLPDLAHYLASREAE